MASATVANITRRYLLKSAPVAVAAATVPAIAQAVETHTEVEALFDQWLVVANGPQDASEDDNWGESRYVRLQDRIVKSEPTNPRDLAIQYYVDCDQFGSDTSDHFEALVKRLVGPVAATENRNGRG